MSSVYPLTTYREDSKTLTSQLITSNGFYQNIRLLRILALMSIPCCLVATAAINISRKCQYILIGYLLPLKTNSQPKPSASLQNMRIKNSYDWYRIRHHCRWLPVSLSYTNAAQRNKTIVRIHWFPKITKSSPKLQALIFIPQIRSLNPLLRGHFMLHKYGFVNFMQLQTIRFVFFVNQKLLHLLTHTNVLVNRSVTNIFVTQICFR